MRGQDRSDRLTYEHRLEHVGGQHGESWEPSLSTHQDACPTEGTLVTNTEQKQDNDESQRHAEQPEQNERHCLSPF
jgi:hypothetical protein